VDSAASEGYRMAIVAVAHQLRGARIPARMAAELSPVSRLRARSRWPPLGTTAVRTGCVASAGYVTYSRDPSNAGYRFYGEVVAVRTDGSGSVQRFGHYHSSDSTYDSEAQAVPSPDGRRVLFASDWADHKVGTPSPGVRSFIFDARDGITLDAPAPEPSNGLRLVSPTPDPTTRGLHVRLWIPEPRPTALELYDLAGRRLYVADAGTLGVGDHVLGLDPDNRLQAGIYFVTLTDGHERQTARAVVLR
jgi:hypothetical protein